MPALNGHTGPDWLDAFKGIEYTAPAGAEHRVVGDLPNVIAPRLRNRLDYESVRIPIRALHDIAQRIDAQSRRIAELEGGFGPVIDQAAVDAWEAQQRELEAAARPSGVYFEDTDDGWAAIYGANGRIAHSGPAADIKNVIEEEGWIVSIFEAPGFLRGNLFPNSLKDTQHAYGAYLRAKRAAEIEAATGRVVDGSATLTQTREVTS